MGYTHYFPHKRNFTIAEFQKLGEITKKIIAASNVPVAWESDEPTKPVEITDDLIRFNGAGYDDGHETFYLPRCADGFIFCKTARKPYDIIVVAVLTACRKQFPDALDIGSDGNSGDWMQGAGLYASIK